MRTDRVLVAAAVVLGVLAIGSTAASYDAAESMSVTGPGEGEESVGEFSESASDRAGGVQGAPLPAWIIENFVTLVFGVGTLVFVLGSVLITLFRGLDGLKWVFSRLGEAVASGVVYLAIVAFLTLLVFGFTGEGVELISEPSAEGAGGSSDGSIGGEPAGADDQVIPYSYAMITFWVLLAVGWFYLFHRGDSDESVSESASGGEELPDDSGDGGPDSAVPQQETISDVPPSNPVYRAWREMASEAQDGTDESLTANEVAATADERGLDDEAVRTLTRLFEEVRYGDRPVTEDRERRAKSALESIERSGGRGT